MVPNQNCQKNQVLDRMDLPKMIVTGASGFIGKNFLEFFKDRYVIYAIARRTQRTCGAPIHQNIHWIRTDLGDEYAVEQTIDDIAKQGPVDYFFHLASYYDYTNNPSPEYERTNVNGTRYILKQLHKLNLKRFIFTSSLTVTEFINRTEDITEKSPADASLRYAVSKRICEEMIEGMSDSVPVTIVRPAAIFSDWCEYGPLYIFLKTWLSKRVDANMVIGKGNYAIPYLHINDLLNFFMRVLEKSDELGDFQILSASPNSCSSHKNLFEIATRYFYGKSSKARFIPTWLAWIGVFFLDVAGGLVGKRPFVRTWMLAYADHAMTIDASYSQRLLNWSPFPRYRVERRLLFLIENMKGNPSEWEKKNIAVISKDHYSSPCQKVYESMVRYKDENLADLVELLLQENNRARFPHYQQVEQRKLLVWVDNFYKMLANAVHSGDRMNILSYAHNMAHERFLDDFTAAEVVDAILNFGEIVVDSLHHDRDCKGLEQRIHDEITMTVQLVEDEVEEVFYCLTNQDDPCPTCVAVRLEVSSPDKKI